MQQHTDDLKIDNVKPLIPPAVLMDELPLGNKASETVVNARSQTDSILHGDDDRLLVVVGPCSIHDTVAALDYAERLCKISQTFIDELCIVMRVYFEKPRTTVGWKGLINDPNLDDSFDINSGLRKARNLLLELANMGLPAGTEFLDTISPQFIADLISWGAIGARTTESQIHRELASGLSMPVGFKNGTNGNIQIAMDAIGAACHPHHFLSVTKQGISAIVTTKGNSSCHLILRGGNNGPNYAAKDISSSAKSLRDSNLPHRVMIDCSHGNSNKDHAQQPVVASDVAEQLTSGSQEIFGVMIESHIEEGKQSYSPDKALVYGQSITDACISWHTTEDVLETLAESVKRRRKNA